MATDHYPRFRRYVKQAGSAIGVVGLSVIVTLLVQHVISPPRATAQVSQQEVRAGAFVLVGQDGTVLGRLSAGDQGNGQLVLFDASGKQRVVLAGAGALVVNDPDGRTARFVAGYTVVPGPNGEPPINGVLLDADGRILNMLDAAGEHSAVQSAP